MSPLSARDLAVQVTLQERGLSAELWMVSNLPPPVHGVSMFNLGILEEFRRRGIQVRFFRVGSESGSGIGRFGIPKVMREGRTIWQVLIGSLWGRESPKSRRILYFTPSQAGPAVFRDAAVSMLGRLLFDRVVAHVHGCGWLEYRSRGGPIAYSMEYALKGCDEVVCLGETFADRMRRGTGLKCVSVDNGATGVAAGKARIAPRTGAVTELLFLGNFIGSKGLWVAAEATEELLDSGLRIRLRCAGEWRNERDQEEFISRFARLLSSGALELLGPTDAAMKERLLCDSHFLLLPTRYPFEGQPMVLIEALSAGLVPVTTDQGGIADLMQFRGSEVLVSSKHDTRQGVTGTVRYLIENRDVYQRLSAACLERYRSHLTVKRCVDELLGVLEGVRP